MQWPRAAHGVGRLECGEAVEFGTHVGHPAVRMLRGRSVRIESPGITAYADGEPLGPLPVDVSIAPSALTVFA